MDAKHERSQRRGDFVDRFIHQREENLSEVENSTDKSEDKLRRTAKFPSQQLLGTTGCFGVSGTRPGLRSFAGAHRSPCARVCGNRRSRDIDRTQEIKRTRAFAKNPRV